MRPTLGTDPGQWDGAIIRSMRGRTPASERTGKLKMRMKLAAILAVLFLVLLFGGCTGMKPYDGDAMLVGPFPGAGLGSVAARAMDKTDRRQAARALEWVPLGQSANWRNRDTGDRFVLTPTRTFEQLGTICRDFTLRAEVGGRADTALGSACRKDDGTWHMSG